MKNNSYKFMLPLLIPLFSCAWAFMGSSAFSSTVSSCATVAVAWVKPLWQVQCGPDEIFKNGFEG